MTVSSTAVEFLQTILNGELQRHRALVHIDNLRKNNKQPSGVQRPLVESLHEYPSAGVNLSHIVEFPPKLALIPVKPIFLDVAWNYIDYPNKTPAAAAEPAKEEKAGTEEPAPQQQKRGWFGFGRS